MADPAADLTVSAAQRNADPPRSAGVRSTRLCDLAGRIEVIARSIRALGLERAAADLVAVSSELRRLGTEPTST